jgi:hypothetical protein
MTNIFTISWGVAKTGSIARASEKLHLTPQTICGQLSLLEEYLGEALFCAIACYRGRTKLIY